MTIAAELKGVTKVFENKTVLNDINLQIHEGETLVLLGPNGSGKTTLLKILAFIENPTKGEVKFHSETVSVKNTEKMRMQSSLVFQRTVMFSASVYDNIAYGLRIRGASRSEIGERVARVLKLVKLEGFEKRSARRLSGGEQQRVALARALALNTRLLLLDEPTANLDPRNASIIEEVIATANRELKTTVVMATHNMFQARSLPHRIALISDGKIGEVGSPAEIFGKLSKTLASFAVLENTFSGTARIMNNGTTLVDIGDGVQLEAAAQRDGDVLVLVSPSDIILSKAPISSSARNVLKGRVAETLDLGTVVKLGVNAGKFFSVQITKSSFIDMRLNLNSEVFLVFKASSVQFL